jgi:hypothetical protein
MIKNVEKIYSKVDTSITYKMTLDDGKVWSVPISEDNTDYQAIQEWIKEGGEVIDNPPTE